MYARGRKRKNLNARTGDLVVFPLIVVLAELAASSDVRAVGKTTKIAMTNGRVVRT